MNPIQQQIRSYISDTVQSDDKITAACSFPTDFIGFDGHFPDNPVLPGICMIQTVLAIGSVEQELTLKEIAQAKFFSPVTANERCSFELTVLPHDDSDFVIKATVSRGSEKIAKIELLVNKAL